MKTPAVQGKMPEAQGSPVVDGKATDVEKGGDTSSTSEVEVTPVEKLSPLADFSVTQATTTTTTSGSGTLSFSEHQGRLLGTLAFSPV